MDYISNYFNKNIEEVNSDDLLLFFKEEKVESNILEFKSYSSQFGNVNNNIEGIIRTICAFLNSDGGVLIWGAPSGVKIEGRQEDVFIGELTPIPELKEKDWFINKISDSIIPLPVGIKFAKIQYKDGYIYIFEIQQSSYSPHQFKSIYFARLDGQTKPAPHYLVEALYRKINYPNLEGYIKFEKIDHNGSSYFLSICVYLFNFSELQNELDVTFRLTLSTGYFHKSIDSSKSQMYLYDGQQLVHKDLISVLHFGSPNYHEETIVLNPNYLLSKCENKLELLLSFGGQKSPLKTSRYILNFNKLNWNQKDNPNYLIESMQENELMSEQQRQKSTTKESTLKSILNR